MAKIQITSQEAEEQIRNLINTFNELKKKLDGIGDKSSNEFKTLTDRANRLEKVIQEVTGTTQNLNKAYNNMSKSQKSAFTQLRNTKDELGKARVKIDEMANSMQKAKKTSDSGIFSGLWRGIKQILGAFGIIAGFQLFANAVKDAFNLTKTLDSLSFAMKAVITDSKELVQTQGWLQDITKNFGAEIVTTTGRFIKFRAAARQAGLSAQETQKIFETMTKVSGVLGLKTDELRGIYLALEQMISKGKITTEELRRQLGERLPGAMDILANSMGVTTAELDKMMKKGEVITKDVLPGFADEVNKAFGLETVNKVETLQAATVRLRNAWTNFISEQNRSSKLSQKLMNIIEWMADNFKLLVNLLVALTGAFVAWKASVLIVNTALAIHQVILKLLNKEYLANVMVKTKAIQTSLTHTGALAAETAATASLGTAVRILIGRLKVLFAVMLRNPYFLLAAGITAIVVSSIKWTKTIKEQAEALNELNQEEVKDLKSKKDVLDNVRDLTVRYEELNKKMGDVVDKTKLTNKESKEYETIIRQIGKAFPLVVAEQDRYGNALTLNNKALKETLQLERELIVLRAEKIIRDQFGSYEDLVEVYEDLNAGQEVYVRGVGRVKKAEDGRFKTLTRFEEIWQGLRGLNPEFDFADPDETLLIKEFVVQMKNALAVSQELQEAAGEIKFGVKVDFQTTGKDMKDFLLDFASFIKTETTPVLPELRQELAELEAAVVSLRLRQEELLPAEVADLKVKTERIEVVKKLIKEITGEIDTRGKQLRQLKEFKDLTEEINRLENEKKQFELEVIIDDPLRSFEEQAKAINDLAQLQIENSQLTRRIKVADAEAEYEAIKKKNDEEMKTASPQRKQELKDNTLDAEKQKNQKIEMELEEHTLRYLKIKQDLKKNLEALGVEMNDAEIDKIEAQFARELDVARQGRKAMLDESNKRIQEAQQVFENSKKNISDRIKLEKVINEERDNQNKIHEGLAEDEEKIEKEKTIAITKELIKQLEAYYLVAKAQGASEEDLKRIQDSIDILKAKLRDLEFPEPDENKVQDWKEAFLEILDAASDFANNIGDIFAAISDRQIESIEAQIKRTEEAYDYLIGLAETNEKNDELLRRNKEQEVQKLEKKRLKAEQKAAKTAKIFSLLQIQLDLAKTITAHALAAAAINATPQGALSLGALGAAYFSIQVPLAIANAAAQTAAVLAAPIPQYAEGGDISHDHIGMINEAGKQEYIERDGKIFTTEKPRALVPLEAGDVIYPSYDDLTKKSMILSTLYNGMSLEKKNFDTAFFGIEESITKGFKKAKINNNINLIGFDPEQNAYRQSLTNW